MILFDHELPPINRVVSVDPYDPSFTLVMIVTGLLLCLACLALIYFSEVNQMSDKEVSKYFVWTSNIAIFVTLLSLLSFYYPVIDYWWYTTTMQPYYHGMTNPLFYGALHIASVFYTFLAMLAAVISPVITALLVKGFERVVTQLRAGAADGVAKQS